MNNQQLIGFLKKNRACAPSLEWLESRTLAEAWEQCERGDWLLWLAAKAGVDRKRLVMAACACARLALVHVPTGEERPRIAIETAEAWCRGEATIEQVREARRNAAAADADAAAADAAYAAAAAADAAYAAAAAYAAHTRALKEAADLVRGLISCAEVASWVAEWKEIEVSRCKVEKAREGRTECEQCSKDHRKIRNQSYAENKPEDLCNSCRRNKPTPGMKMCASCRILGAAAARKRAEKKKAGK